MIVQFDRSFYKSIKGLSDDGVKKKIADFVNACEKASSLSGLKNIKKLQGHHTFYRLRIGDYRLGFELTDPSTIVFIIACHRKDIYRLFP